LQLAELIQNLIGVKEKPVFHPLPQDDPRRRKPDISKAVKMLTWTPIVPVEEGLKKTIAYFQKKLRR
jgi:UDP-glucuronate decarboxylase